MTEIKRENFNYGVNVESLLDELSQYETSDISSGEFDAEGEGEYGATGFCTIEIPKLAEDAVKIIAALLQQVQALAAENTALTELYRKSVTDLDGMCFEMGMMRGEKSMEYPAPETPATDAVLREIRAQAMDDFGIYHNFSDKQSIQSAAKKFAARIRAGE